jgi:hypothetical protein
MSQRFGIGDVIDGYDFDIAIVERSASNVPTDAAKTVDAYFHRHAASQLRMDWQLRLNRAQNRAD